jgi:hypothetical protein
MLTIAVMSPNRGGTLASRPTDASPRRDESVSTTELDRLVGSRRPAVWGNPKLAIGGGLAALVALVALGVTQADFSSAPNDQVAQAPVDVAPAPDDVPSDAPPVTALPSDPIGSDRTPGSPGAVEPVLPAASGLEATASCNGGSCVIDGTVTLNVSAARLEAVAGSLRVAIADPGTAGRRAVSFTLPADSGCFQIEALDRNGKTGGASNQLCLSPDGTLSAP